MISFRTVDGTTYNKLDDAIEHEKQCLKLSRDRRRRGTGSEMIYNALRDNLAELRHYKKNGVCIPPDSLMAI